MNLQVPPDLKDAILTFKSDPSESHSHSVLKDNFFYNVSVVFSTEFRAGVGNYLS